MLRKKVSLAVLLVLALTLSGCLGNLFGGPKLAKLVISAGATQVEQGKSVNLSVKGLDQNNKEMKVSGLKWTLGDTSKGTLKPDGAKAVFTAGANATGKVKVSVSAEGKSTSIEIEIVKSGSGGDDPGDGGEPSCCDGLPIVEDFSAADSSEFFSASYKHLPGDPTQPLYVFTGATGGGGVFVEDGKLTLAGARFAIGMPEDREPTSSSDTDAGGTLDLSKPYKITIEIVDVQIGTGNTKFQVYVDNNTTSAGNSIHRNVSSTASRIYDKDAKELEAGDTIVINSSRGTPNSFLQLRTEGGATVTLGGFTIEYQ